ASHAPRDPCASSCAQAETSALRHSADLSRVSRVDDDEISQAHGAAFVPLTLFAGGGVDDQSVHVASRIVRQGDGHFSGSFENMRTFAAELAGGIGLPLFVASRGVVGDKRRIRTG